MRRPTALVLLWTILSLAPVAAQVPTFDTDWYVSGSPYVKLAVAEDGVYRVDVSELATVSTEVLNADPTTFRVLENGKEIPISYEGIGLDVGPSDYFLFVGRRNTAADEAWVYGFDESLRSSDYHSLYTDTTTYFLTWGDSTGLRFSQKAKDEVAGTTTDRVTVDGRLEIDRTYVFGAPESSGNPLYTDGEGYYTNIFSHGREAVIRRSYDLWFEDFARLDDTMKVDLKLRGGSRAPHLGFVDVAFLEEGSNSVVETALDSVRWSNYEAATLSFELPQKAVPGSVQRLRINVGSDNSIEASPAIMYLDYVSYRYARFLNPDTGPLSFTPESVGPATFQLTGSADTDVIVLEPETAARFDLKGNETFGDGTAPTSTYWLTSSGDVKRPVILRDASSNLGSTAFDADYVIVAAPGLVESAQELAAYRASDAGGQYNTMVVNVQDIFDQFDFGRATPIALKRFVDRMRLWRSEPLFMALWGDALYPDARRSRFDWEVPSFGNASSDGWFAMHRGGDQSNWVEALAIGRITVRGNDAGSAFVAKLRAYESSPPSDWQKRAIMMSGGATESQQISLRGSTVRWGTDMAGSPFGGDITYFHKTSTSALDPTFLDSVDAAIAGGSGWLAFFGHSAADTWEIVTEPPPLFANSQSLPVAVSLGCFTGAYARGDGSQFDFPVFAELLVTESENGAIAHYGGSTSSFISVARQIANPFYDLVFQGGVRILGNAVIRSKELYLGNQPNGTQIETALQYNLLGDPATRMVLPSAPDFHIEPRSVVVTPDAPVAGIDSTIEVTISIQNRGLVSEDTTTVELVHVDPSGGESTYRIPLPGFPLTFQTTISIPIGASTVGRNLLRVAVDPEHIVAETTEQNNVVEITQLVFDSGVVQLYPPDFGLVSDRRPSLRFTKASAAADRLPATIELDTTDAFDSPELVSETVEAELLSNWTPPSLLSNGSTYFWRVAANTGDASEWRTRTFTVQDELPFNGWLQRGSQFQLNDHDPSVQFTNGTWDLATFGLDVRIRSAQFRATAPNTIIVGGFEHQTLEVGFAAVIVSVEGVVTASGWFVPYPNVYGQDEIEEREELKAFLASARDEEYVLVNSRFIRIAPGVVDMPEETKQIFRDLGSTQIDSVDLNDLFNFALRIGDNVPLADEWQDRDPSVGPHILWTDLSLPIRFASGGSASPLVGPATMWHEVQATGVVESDESSLQTIILSMDGDTLGSQTLEAPGGTTRIDLSPSGLNIDAGEHPFLRLKVVLTDSARLNTPQLIDWYVGYDPVAELVVDAPAFNAVIDTVAEGEPVQVSVNVTNGGPNTVDTVFVSYLVTGADNRTNVGAVDTLLGVAPDATVESSSSLGTLDMVGDNRVTVTVEQTAGPEPAAFNNTAIGRFTVLGDRTPPLFSLTADGASYPNDPRVITTTDDPTLPFFSARPSFEITLTDENQFLSLADTTAISMTLDNVRINYARSDVQFSPGTPPGNEASLISTPDFTGQDTTHTLKAWAQDASGNSEPTKEEPYTLSFRVQTDAEVESLYPYPNPMHNYTTFMFKLRGADASLVDDFRLRIYTISGRPVREFDLLDNPNLLDDGGLRIGWNRLSWDGRDEDGDLLATGVYLYKVFLKADGRTITVNNDTGIEKLAIIR